MPLPALQCHLHQPQPAQFGINMPHRLRNTPETEKNTRQHRHVFEERKGGVFLALALKYVHSGGKFFPSCLKDLSFAQTFSNSFFVFLLCVFFPVLLTGCLSLPEGEKPEGNIVDNPGTDVVRVDGWKAAEERLITGLTLATLANLPGQPVRLVADEKYLPLLGRVIRAVGLVSGVKQGDSSSAYVLTFREKNGQAEATLENIPGKRILWRDRFEVR
ncbi:MAG: hypothetical protein PHS41_12685 [Victivallaceae bacterium]|nr:hypothetical protein [Victivallaceae bacterium]